jgi:chromate transporter
MSERGILTELAIQFALISVISIGGAVAVLPEMHRAAVEVHGWMSSETFANLFALAQAAPGPNVIIVTLIGWHVAGVPGALIATVAMTGPAFILAYGASQAWERWHKVQWYKTFERGVVPITVGLIAASGCLLTSASGYGWANYLITAATVACVLFTRINPLIVLSGAALLGLTGML